MEKLFWLVLGGSLGTVARFSLSAWALESFGAGFPYGTVCVNLLGTLMIGVFMGLSDEGALAFLGPWLYGVRLLVVTGFLGAFTTFSTYQFDSLLLMKEGLWQRAGLNLMGSMVVGFGVVWVGYSAGRWLAQCLMSRG